MMTLCFKKNGKTIYEFEVFEEISVLEEMKILKGYQNLLRQSEILTHCSKKLGVSDAIQ
jgi:hypothetical protein